MSSEINFISVARNYDAANAAYYATDAGQEEIAAKTAFKTAYLGCNASDQEKLAAISKLASDTVDKFNKSYVVKHEKGILEVKDNKITLEQFVEAAANYETKLHAAKEVPAFSAEVKAAGAFRTAVVALLKNGSNPQALRQELVDNNITNKRVLSRPEYWQKKFC